MTPTHPGPARGGDLHAPTDVGPSASGAADPVGVGGMRILARGLTGRCPACGSRGLFPRFLSIAPRCPRCGYNFERESGWWLGAMTMNIGAALIVYMAFLVGSMLLTWPDVPWGLLTVAGVVLMAVFPLAFVQISRTLWIALEILLRRMG